MHHSRVYLLKRCRNGRDDRVVQQQDVNLSYIAIDLNSDLISSAVDRDRGLMFVS